MKQALIIVSFGTGVPEAQKSIFAVEEALAYVLPDTDIYTCITSPTIRRILARRGERTYSPEETLERLSPMGYDRVILQPTHLLPGIEYDKLRTVTDSYAPRFPTLVLGKPLLSDDADLETLSRCLGTHYGACPEAPVLVGHGTEHDADRVYGALEQALYKAGLPRFCVGTIEGSRTLDTVAQQLRLRGETSVLLIPLMLTAGNHAQNDIAGLTPDSWKSRLETAGFTVCCHMEGLGLLPEVQELYCRHLLEIL